MSVQKWLLRSAVARKALARAAIVAAAIGATVFAFPSASRADGSYFDWCSKANVSCQTGATSGDPWNFDKCMQDDTHRTTVCVVYEGDQVFVYDGREDGHSAMGIVFSDAGDVTERYCRNPHGFMTWAKCDFNWAEDTEKTVYGGIRYDNDSHWWVKMWTFNNN